MFKNLKWLRIVPDAPGKGGQKSGFHTFQVDPVNDIRVLSGYHVYAGRWRRDYASLGYGNLVDDTATVVQGMSLHAYTYPNLTDPSAQPSLTLLCHDRTPTASRYWEFTSSGALRDSHALESIPATFLNIQGRCFVADGAREGMILDDRTPAIHTQKNQNLGIGTPTQALSGNSAQNLTPGGTGYVHLDSPYINHPNANNPIGNILATDLVTPYKIDGWTAIYSGALMASATPTGDAVSSNRTPFTATGTIAINPAVDPDKVTLTGWTWPADFQYCGLSINFNGYSFVLLNTGPTPFGARNVNGGLEVLTNVEALLLGEYSGPAYSGPYTITGCQITMGAHPAADSTLQVSDTAAPTIGYSQSTASDMVQVFVFAAIDGGGLYRGLGNISLGPPIGEEGATGVIQYVTDAAMPDNRPKLTSASNPFADTDVDSPIGVDGASSTGGVLITTIKTFVDPGTVRLAVSNTSGGAIAAKNAWWGADPIISDGAMVMGSTTLTSASNPFVAGDVGQTIVVEGAGAAGTSLITTISVYVGVGNVTLTAANASGGNVTNARVWWRGISTLTHAGPTYAYSWYDPETGHMSNISPLYQLPRPTQISNYVDFSAVTPVFQINEGWISYPAGVDATRFSHIIFFRTLSDPNSSTLYPIGSLMPYVGKVHPGSASTRGSWNPSTYHGWMGLPNNYTAAPPVVITNEYWYDFSSDEDLILTGGFRAPQFTNEKPMALLAGGLTQPAKVAYQAYWDRRLWVTSTQEPDKVAFSCDEAQCPLGIPVESFPPTNFLRIPSVDGHVTGMKMVGDMLLIMTNRWAYTVAGNNESNYRLLRVSTRLNGVGTYQISELPSDVEGQSAVIYFLGTDKIVYEWVPGGGIKAISDPVRDLVTSGITNRSDYTLSRVHCVSAWARRLVVVGVALGSGHERLLIFDVDNRTWKQCFSDTSNQPPGVGPSAFATIYGTDPPVNEIYLTRVSPFTAVRMLSWLRDDQPVQSTAVNFGEITTFPLTFDGKKTRKQLVMVNLHVSSTAGGSWTVGAGVNEGSLTNVTAATYPDTAYSVYGSGPVNPVDSATERDLVALTAQFNATGAALVGYRFVVSITSSVTATPTELWAIDIGYVDWEDPGEGDP